VAGRLVIIASVLPQLTFAAGGEWQESGGRFGQLFLLGRNAARPLSEGRIFPVGDV
jgi:hypothetical protein